MSDHNTTIQPFDTLGFIVQLEQGDCSDEDIVHGMQHLLDNGMAWQLQGSYGRMASDLIAMGHCHPARKELH